MGAMSDSDFGKCMLPTSVCSLYVSNSAMYFRGGCTAWPVKKPDGTWRMMVDHLKLNKETPLPYAVVPNITDPMETDGDLGNLSLCVGLD